MEIREFLEEVRKDTITEIIESLRFIAQGSYEETLRRKQYADKTGRLSSSIGWARSYDGKVVHSGGFTGQGRKASAGQTSGRDVVSELARENNGISLILVAGAPYATQVEAQGFDVTTSGELLAEELVEWWLNNA